MLCPKSRFTVPVERFSNLAGELCGEPDVIGRCQACEPLALGFRNIEFGDKVR